MDVQLSTDIVTEIRWTDTAWEHWKRAVEDAAHVGAYYGDAVGIHQREQLYRMIVNATFAAGPCRVMKDGDGFLIVTNYITMGLVWTPDSDQGMVKRFDRRGLESSIILPLPADWPRTGEWSLHS